ncbi:unnamed protein product [Paramecium sonneborni]|uniref:Uncharacterized protein n=1 Tax=Paramecium sonneborni TaxID=65129 RepID=A0A8S1KA40_9CILI|nr:unnamed protein product [Paramecium sonneborni]
MINQINQQLERLFWEVEYMVKYTKCKANMINNIMPQNAQKNKTKKRDFQQLHQEKQNF